MEELDETALQVKKIKVMKQFRDELHEISDLRVERLQSKIQIVKQQDKILDLIIEARENGDKEKLKEASGVKKHRSGTTKFSACIEVPAQFR